jgi:surface protein
MTLTLLLLAGTGILSEQVFGAENIASGSYENTTWVIDVSYLFDECYYLTDVDLSGFDTCKVTNMESMFKDCPRLKNWT